MYTLKRKREGRERGRDRNWDWGDIIKGLLIVNTNCITKFVNMCTYIAHTHT